MRTYDQLIAALNNTCKWWMIGKGKAKPGEPLWGCVIQEPRVNGDPVAKAEGDSLAECIEQALSQITK